MRFRPLNEEIVEERQRQTARVLQSLGKILVRLDRYEKDYHTADKLLHDRHERRIERLEAKTGLKSVI